MIALKVTRKGWYRFWGQWRTGSVDVRSGAWLPEYRDGVPLPPTIMVWSGPYSTAGEAVASC